MDHLLQQFMESNYEPTGPPSASCNRCKVDLLWRYQFYNLDGTLHICEEKDESQKETSNSESVDS